MSIISPAGIKHGPILPIAENIPENDAGLLSAYTRYREEVDLVVGQGADLYNHIAKIESGEAEQTQVNKKPENVVAKRLEEIFTAIHKQSPNIKQRL